MVLNDSIIFKTPAELEKESQQVAEGSTTYEVKSQLADLIARTWEINRRHKEDVTRRLMYCLRARKGEYSADEQAAILAGGGAANPVYMKLTGTKCRAASAWIRDIMLPVDSDYPFSIMSTPEADVEPGIKRVITKNAFAQAAALIAKTGEAMTPEEIVQFRQQFYDEVMLTVQQYAGKAALAMETKIKDKMAEGNWVKALEEFIEDFVTYPVAVMKGPFHTYKKTLTWKNGVPKVKNELTLSWTRRSPFDIYPAPYQDTLQKGNFIDRIMFTREEMYNLIGLEGYSESKIRTALEEWDNGMLYNWAYEDWEREQLESSSYFYAADRDTVEALHFWGNVQGKVLKEWGINEDLDEDDGYEIDAILVGNHVIRAVINDNPLGERPYHAACWDAIPGSFYGIALPEQMEEHQRIVNTAARSLIENMSLTSGVQAIVMVDQLPPGEQLTTIVPKKIWQMRAPLSGGSNQRPVEFFVPPSVAQELMAVGDAYENKADDVTNVPRYSYGNEKISGAGSTATGLGMLMTSAAKGIRRALAQIDTLVIKPTVQQAFVELMLNDPDPMIKGDIKIVAKGSTALLIKENEQQRMLAFLRELAPFVGPATIEKLANEISKLMNLDITKELRIDSQMRMQMQQQQQQAAVADTMMAKAQENSAEIQRQNQASVVA